MKNNFKILLFFLIFGYGLQCNAQQPDEIRIAEKNTVLQKETTFRLDSTDKILKPDPMKVVWMGTIIPGFGQILNHKYWKLPIVYGGFLGCTYFISWNSIRYNAYKTAYKDIIDSDPNTSSYIDILPSGYTVDSYGGISAYTNVLKSGMEQTRYNRDLSVIISAGFYLLTLVDAYVDAQLYDFDISPDLSLKISPALLKNSYGINNTFGLQLSINLK